MNGIMKAVVLSIVMLAGSAAMGADICTGDSLTDSITCDNGADGTYSEWIVGKHTASNTIYACAKIDGVWTRVGLQAYTTSVDGVLYVKGDALGETISIVDTTGSVPCDAGLGLYVTRLPSDWFGRIEVYGYSSMDTITGSYRDEYIWGGTYGDTIDGRAGNDDIDGESGQDTISGGLGNDTIDGGTGNDTINGNSGIDTINGGDGDDTIYGGSGDDDLYGDAGADWIWGETGDDDIWGGSEDDHLYGDEDDDYIQGNTGRDYFEGNDGEDELRGGDDIDTIKGGDNNDELYGGDHYDYCDGEAFDANPPGNFCNCESETSCQS